ncbi:MAG: putative DNA-binding protein [Evtepia sp.]|jgi:hypothetical protein|nr:putative DNA-binding protein [Evtepia sp.]
MEVKYCQSCGMPMGNTDELYGTEALGNKNPDYCTYCYKDGNFTFQGTMDEMIEICVPHMVQSSQEMTEDVAREMMRAFFPTLKRWKNA